MNNDRSYHIETTSDIPRIAKQFLEDYGHRRVFAFDAEMGAGKTTFILGLLNAMGIEIGRASCREGV